MRYALALFLLVGPVQAQVAPPCAPRADLLQNMREKFGEVPLGYGQTGNGVMELLTSPNGNWTLILSQPTGKSCLLATGEGWETTRQPGKEI